MLSTAFTSAFFWLAGLGRSEFRRDRYPLEVCANLPAGPSGRRRYFVLHSWTRRAASAAFAGWPDDRVRQAPERILVGSTPSDSACGKATTFRGVHETTFASRPTAPDRATIGPPPRALCSDRVARGDLLGHASHPLARG